MIEPDVYSTRKEIIFKINSILPKYLNEKETAIIRFRIGLKPNSNKIHKSLTTEEVAKIMTENEVKELIYTKERIRQMESKAMKKLKEKAARELEHFRNVD